MDNKIKNVVIVTNSFQPLKLIFTKLIVVEILKNAKYAIK